MNLEERALNGLKLERFVRLMWTLNLSDTVVYSSLLSSNSNIAFKDTGSIWDSVYFTGTP